MMTDGESVTTLVPGRLTICTYGGFAPVCYASETGHLLGLDVSFLTRFAATLGLTLATIEQPFDGLWTRPGANVCDVAGAGIMRRDDRRVEPGGAWSGPYFYVQRSLLVRSAEQAEFDTPATLAGKVIVVTRGSTAEIDARTRYPNCTIQTVDMVAEGQANPQEHIVRTLLAHRQVDAFAEGDLCNRYLRDAYGEDVAGGLALADCHRLDGPPETFNFVVRAASLGVLDRLNDFIASSQGSYAPGSS